jgi:hypothetical protein
VKVFVSEAILGFVMRGDLAHARGRASASSCPRAERVGKVVCMRVERGVCPRACADGRFGTVAVVCTPGVEGMRTLWSAGAVAGQDGVAMEIERARLLAERLHADDFEEDGSALLEHVRRVVCRVDADVQVVAWLHEVLEWTVVAEDELLRGGLDSEQLRALRLLYCAHDARSGGVYLAHVGLIARAARQKVSR